MTYIINNYLPPIEKLEEKVMVKTNQPLIKITELDQVCIVVHDIDKSVASMWNNFGVGPWNIVDLPPESMSDLTYYGKPARFGFKAALTQKRIGGIEFELIQPTIGDSIYRDYLKQYGEGIQHLGHHKINSLETLANTLKVLEREGFPCIMSGRTILGTFSYIDTRSVLNTILELCWFDPSVKTPPPDYVFPKKI
jgi:methylmalonyl-CoA/ethylmalonyl-CoA epimerase